MFETLVQPTSAAERHSGPPRHRVGIVRTASAAYPKEAPYHPSAKYPEYPFGQALAEQPNVVYEGVRLLLNELEYDHDHFGTAQWNPLGHIIEPGMTVVLKPNFVLSRHAEGKDVYGIITHPSVLRAVMDYCWIALKGRGRIIVADAPQYNCHYQELLATTGLDRTCAFFADFRGPEVGHRDLRRYWSANRHFPSMIQALPGDPEGIVRINLGRISALYGKRHSDQLYGAVYHREETTACHSGECHEYEISGTILGADVVISVPKLKVHKKVGVTLNAKGLVGTATNKNMIVHYTLGSPSEGGDQYPDGLFTPTEKLLIKTERWMYDHFLAPRSQWLERLHRSIYWLHNHTTRKLGLKVAEHKRLLDAGNWFGNDSAWRMTIDLLRIFYFADRHGLLHDTPQRRFFSVIDGVVGGEGNGPLTPDPKLSAVLVGGESPLAVDLVATRIMGFDPNRLKSYAGLFDDPYHDFGVRGLRDIEVCSADAELRCCAVDCSSRFLDFRPHPGWVGHLEVGGAGNAHD